MNNCTLRPPNSQLFSDDVIGSVMQRAWIAEGSIESEAGDSSDLNDEYQSLQYSEFIQVHDRLKACEDVQGREPQLGLTPVERKRERDESEFFSHSKMAALDAPERGVATNKVAARVEEHQRELRRMRQIRYRKKKHQFTLRLQEDTTKLLKKVEDLEQRRRASSIAVPTNKSVWEIAFEYFQVFRFGIQDPPMTLQKPPSKSIAPSSPQKQFLLATMTEDVVFNAMYGAEAIMKMWRCQTLWLKDFELELEGLVKEKADSLVASTTTSFIVTERTLRKVFPHLCGTRAWRSHIADTLLGQRITARGSARFEWDRALGRVTSLTTQTDLLMPVLHLLGNLEDVSLVFGKALVSPDFQWRGIA